MSVYNLKDFQQSDIKVMFHNYEYYSCLIWRKDNVIRSIHKEITSLLDCDKYEQELWVLLSHAAKSIKHNCDGWHMSLDEKHYVSANKSFKVKLSRTRMRCLLDTLSSLGFIELYIGFYTKAFSCISAVRICDKLSKLFSNKVLCGKVDKRDIDNLEIVDVEQTIVTKEFNIKEMRVVKMKDVVLKDTRGVKGAAEIKKGIERYNLCIMRHKVSIDLGRGDEESNCIIYKRRFEGDLKNCGRYYTMSSFQTIPSEFRKTIKIDGESTVELDFKNCHPRIIADLCGYTLGEDFDCYSIDKLSKSGVSRELTKELLFPVLFSNSKVSAISSIRNKLREAGIKSIKADDVLECFLEHNKFLEGFLFSIESYRTLQYMDSSIATLIINHFTNKDIVVLCYHDSFVIQSKYEDELRELMSDSYLSVIGFNDNMSINKV